MDVDRRKPVWLAISDLCLDTAITEETIGYIARTIKEQGFSAAEATEIAFYEVFPAVAFNLYLVAGEWACFSEDWLFDRIVKKQKSAVSRFFIRFQQRQLHVLLDQDWNRVLYVLEQADTATR